jgi:large subunit ribosomal protein L29
VEADMRASELRDMTRTELETRLHDLEQELFNLHLRHVTQELTNPLRMRTVRREIARIHTIMREAEQKLGGSSGGRA